MHELHSSTDCSPLAMTPDQNCFSSSAICVGSVKACPARLRSAVSFRLVCSPLVSRAISIRRCCLLCASSGCPLSADRSLDNTIPSVLCWVACSARAASIAYACMAWLASLPVGAKNLPPRGGEIDSACLVHGCDLT